MGIQIAMNYRYETLAENIEQAIAKGVYPVGARLPSIRQTGRNHRVSLTTAMQAYARLEERGLIHTRPKSGHFVSQPVEARSVLLKSRPRQQPGEATISKIAMDVVAASSRSGMVALGAAVPGPATLPLAELSRCYARAARMHRTRASLYEAPNGAPELRSAISRLLLDLSCNEGPEDIVISNGAQEALVLALRAIAKPGDIVAIESPTYFGVIQALEALGLRALEIPTDPRRGIDIDALEAAAMTHKLCACILMPNIQNPLGFRMADADKEYVVALLARRGVVLIEDDVFGALGIGTSRPKAAKAFDQAGNVILLGSFSKTISPALRIGWLAPGRYREEIERQKFLLNLSSATIPQLAMADFLTGNRYRRATQAAAVIYARRLRRLRDEVIKAFPDGTTCSVPVGGLFLWVALPASFDTMALFQEALAEGMSISPGRLFTRSRDYRNCLRLSCAAIDEEKIPNAIARLRALMIRSKR